MADVKISALPVASSLDSTETIAVVQGGITVQATLSQITVIAPTATRSGNLLDAFASGTALVFNQTSAPTGWTKSSTHNDKALRVVSGTVGSGGSTAFTSVFGAGKITGSHVLAVSEMPSHDHGGATGTANTIGGLAWAHMNGGINIQVTAGSLDGTFDHTHNISAQGGGGGHDHTLSLDIQYADVVICTKN